MSKKAKKPFGKMWQVIVVAVIFAAVGCAYKLLHPRANVSTKPLSRAVLELAEAEVRKTKPEPTLAALQYAYVASGYYEGAYTGNQAEALYVSEQLLNTLYAPDTFTSSISTLAKQYHVNIKNYATSNAKNVASAYLNRYKKDGHDLVWDGKMPVGVQYWYKTKDAEPFTPRAGEWKRWNVTSKISVPAPPVIGSAQDAKELQIVQVAAENRTGEDINKINFWGGTPGTDSPSGIWQNQLFLEIGNELTKNKHQADLKYAYIQKYTAQSVSDAFMECWKVKYTYWTARPSMRIAGFSTAMPDPYFPAYVSGHSTISKAAADVLSVMVPAHTKQWQDWAVEARNSRLAAGVHFEIDNTVGFQLGTDVAKQEVAANKLTQQL